MNHEGPDEGEYIELGPSDRLQESAVEWAQVTVASGGVGVAAVAAANARARLVLDRERLAFEREKFAAEQTSASNPQGGGAS